MRAGTSSRPLRPIPTFTTSQTRVYDVVGLTNWHSEPETRELNFADKLGLAADGKYVVFDFWTQTLLGVFSQVMKAEIAPHDTRVVAIHPLESQPQLLGTSRHITGAYSIREVRWDAAKKTLQGLSETVPGDDYTLFFYLPKGFEAASARVTAGGHETVVHPTLQGRLLQLTFPGQGPGMEWSVTFTTKAKGGL